MDSDPRRHAPATERNRQAILEVLERVLPAPCLVLEIASLRAQCPEWGVRDLEEVVACAEGAGFSLSEVVAMPANNLSVLLIKQ